MENSILAIVIPSCVTIIGFFVNYKLLTREKNLDIYKYKNEEQIKKMIDVPMDIIFFMNCLYKMLAKSNIDPKKFREAKEHIYNSVLCYGSEDAVKILRYFQYLLTQGIEDEVGVNASKVIAPLALLLMQIKYDITDIKTSPKVWYVEFMSQKSLEENFYESSVKEINGIVDQLNLKDFLKITDMGIY